MKKTIAVDVETTGLDHWHGDMPFSIAWYDGVSSEYYDWPIDVKTRKVLYDWRGKDSKIRHVRKLMQDPSITKIFHNGKFDVRMLEQACGIEVRGKIHDTMLMAHHYNSDEMNYRLKPLAKKYLEIPDDDEADLRKAVLYCRKEAKKLGWKLGGEYQYDCISGELVFSSSWEQDYWLPKALNKKCKLNETYNIQDVVRTYWLYRLYKKLLKDDGAWKCYLWEIELWHVVYRMETTGVHLDLKCIDERIKEFRKEAKKSLAVVVEAAEDKDFNLNSSKQLGALLYDKLGLPVTERTGGGNRSVSKIALKQLYGKHPVIEAIYRYRAYVNSLRNYFYKYKLYKIREGDNWVLKPDFQICGARTGRFSCRRPNLQNIEDEVGTRAMVPIQARDPLIPRPGHRWYAFDYAQLEIKIFADIAKETSMLKAIKEEQDILTMCADNMWGGANERFVDRAIYALDLQKPEPYSETVRKVWKKYKVKDSSALTYKDIEEIAYDWGAPYDYSIVDAEKSVGVKRSRGIAKCIFYGKIYGGGPGVVADLAGVSVEEARKFMDNYSEQFPNIERFVQTITQRGRRDGYLIDAYGRRLSVDPNFAYRGVNYMIQGSAASMLKRAMRSVFRYLRSSDLDAELVLTIHDELIIEILNQHSYRWFIRRIKEIMEDHGGAFSIPFSVDVERIRKNWSLKEECNV